MPWMEHEMEPVKTILRFADGRIVKGYTRGFDPRKSSFLFEESREGTAGKPAKMQFDGLKAIFFVKDFHGNSHYSERKSFKNGDRPEGQRVEVTFLDGERIQGFTIGYDAQRPGFFFFPADTESNHFGIFVIAKAVLDLRPLNR